MQKKLPKIYQNTFSHKIENNNKVFYSAYQDHQSLNINRQTMNRQMDKNIVETSLNELFQTTGYIFNIPVEIKTKEKTLNTKIAGKVKNTIITLDNDVIPISSIVSIKRKDR